MIARSIVQAGALVAAVALTQGSARAQTPSPHAVPVLAERVRGVVRAIDHAVISAPLQKPLIAVPKRVGARFRKGELLLRFDCAEETAQLRIAKAGHRSKALVLANRRRLRNLRAIGTHEVNLARADVARAAAEMDLITARLERCEIKAPFDGSVAAIHAKAHETPARDGRLLTLVSTRRLDLKIIVPSRWIQWLKPDRTFAFVVDDTDRTYRARVVARGRAVDPISQTFVVIGIVENVDDLLLPGMSGEAVFKRTGS
ncbi:MAG: HlyD family efflux transporter periplasmic adaptor subunit [Pseudomonadota bacterium]